MSVELLLNLACLKYTGQTLPNCGDELATTWKFKLVDGKKVAIQLKPSPLYLRPSSNFSIELDIKRRMVVDSLNSIFSWKDTQETCKWRYDHITQRSSETADTILFNIGFTEKQIELMNNNKDKIGSMGGDSKAQFLLYLFQLGIPYESNGVKGFLKLEKDRYGDHPETERHSFYGRDKKKILRVYSEHKPEHFEKDYRMNYSFWYGKTSSYDNDERKWMNRKNKPASIQFRLENPENFKKDDYLKKGKKFQLDYLRRRFARGGAGERWINQQEFWTMTKDYEVRDEWINKYGREWLDEGKLDTKTLLRVYANQRESYEKVIERIQF